MINHLQELNSLDFAVMWRGAPPDSQFAEDDLELEESEPPQATLRERRSNLSDFGLPASLADRDAS